MKFGLDFGTTNSSISIFDGKKAEVLPIDHVALDPRVVRSMVFLKEERQSLTLSLPGAK